MFNSYNVVSIDASKPVLEEAGILETVTGPRTSLWCVGYYVICIVRSIPPLYFRPLQPPIQCSTNRPI